MLKYKFVPVHRRATASLTTTPEPTPRMSRTLHYQHNGRLQSYGSEMSLIRNNYMHGSNNSLASITSTTNAYTKLRKGKAPRPPSASRAPRKENNELSLSIQSNGSSPNISGRCTPVSARKKRTAPLPPSLVSVTPAVVVCSTPKAVSDSQTEYMTALSNLDDDRSQEISNISNINTSQPNQQPKPMRKLIPLDDSLLDDSLAARLNESTEPITVNYRRTIVPYAQQSDDSSAPPVSIENYRNDDSTTTTAGNHDRQWQKVKENKESQNKNRQSQISLSSPTNSPDSDPQLSVYSNKSTFGKWKRRKGPAPGLPIPPRKVLQMLPLQEIRHELEVIEVQQQGLEKQVHF